MENITWEYLATFSGSVFAVTAITEALKRLIKVNPKWIALILAALIQAGVQVFHLAELTPDGLLHAIVNIAMVTGASVGVFECFVKPVENKFKKDGGKNHES